MSAGQTSPAIAPAKGTPVVGRGRLSRTSGTRWTRRSRLSPSLGLFLPAKVEAESLLQLNVRMSAESRADLGRLLDVWPGRRPTFRDVIEDLITAESARPPGSSSRMTDAGPRSNGPQVTAQLNVRISASSRAELGQLVMVWGGRRPAIRDVIEDLVAAELARRGLDDSS